MTTQCEHGQLGRVCLMCEMRDENIALRARAERAEAERDELRRDSNRAWQRASEVEEERDHLIIYKMNAQSTIADLTGQVERLREALTKVRPWFTPETMIGAGMIKIVDAALGGEKSTAPAFTLPPETPPPE